MTNRPRTKPGLRDVAKHAKVSLASASRALSHPELVSEAVRTRVQSACRDLHYIPNRTARRLSQSRSETIGLIVPDISNPLFAPTIDGLNAVLDAAGFGMMVNSAERDPQRELAQIKTMLEHGVDAVATLMPSHDPELAPLLDMGQIPCVYLSHSATDEHRPAVGYDNIGAMREIVSQVLAAGHRRIGVLSGPRSSTPIIAERLEATLAALAEADCAPPTSWIGESAYTASAARASARQMLRQPDRPGAIVCTGDQHAVAAIMEAHALGIAVPAALSVTGCNDVSIARLCHPQLTTVRLPYREIGEVAGRILIERINGASPGKTTRLPYRLMLRETLTAPDRT